MGCSFLPVLSFIPLNNYIISVCQIAGSRILLLNVLAVECCLMLYSTSVRRNRDAMKNLLLGSKKNTAKFGCSHFAKQFSSLWKIPV